MTLLVAVFLFTYTFIVFKDIFDKVDYNLVEQELNLNALSRQDRIVTNQTINCTVGENACIDFTIEDLINFFENYEI